MLAAVGCGVVLAGCTVGPNFQPPTPAAKNAFPDRSLGQAGTTDVEQTTALGVEIGDWWTLLGSPKLDQLVNEALSRNWSLTSREAMLAQARKQLAGVRGENYPAIGAVGQAGQTRIGATAFGPNALAFPIFSAYAAGLTASYDPDIFGGRRRRLEATAAGVDEDIDERDAATLTLIANVSLQSIQIAVTNREIALAQGVVAADQQTLDLVDRAHAAGAAPNTDVLQAEAQRDHDRALLPALRQRLETARDTLATLVGRSPADWTAPDFTLGDFSLPASLPGVIPSELAHRRPDILAAEARLHGASAAIGVATADLYPRVDLSAAVSEAGLFAGPSETAWNMIGGAAAPIFNGGRLRAAKSAAQAAYRARFADYQQVVVSALGQIADLLNALANDADTLAAQESAVASASRSLDLSRQGYAAGGADLTRVLDAQRLRDQADEGAVEATGARLADTVKLFLALGLRPIHEPDRRLADSKPPVEPERSAPR